MCICIWTHTSSNNHTCEVCALPSRPRGAGGLLRRGKAHADGARGDVLPVHLAQGPVALALMREAHKAVAFGPAGDGVGDDLQQAAAASAGKVTTNICISPLITTTCASVPVSQHRSTQVLMQCSCETAALFRAVSLSGT